MRQAMYRVPCTWYFVRVYCTRHLVHWVPTYRRLTSSSVSPCVRCTGDAFYVNEKDVPVQLKIKEDSRWRLSYLHQVHVHMYIHVRSEKRKGSEYIVRGTSYLIVLSCRSMVRTCTSITSTWHGTHQYTYCILHTQHICLSASLFPSLVCASYGLHEP